MTEKNQQEKMAAERQVELFTKAFGKAKEDNGIWLDNNGRKAPGLYQKHLQVSAFNAIILGMHAAQNGYKTNQYTLFRKRRNVVSLFNQKRKEYHSSGTTGTSMSTSTTLKTKSAVQTIRLSLQTSKQTTKVSEAVKLEPCSISSRLPYPWLTRPPLKQQSRNMAG